VHGSFREATCGAKGRGILVTDEVLVPGVVRRRQYACVFTRWIGSETRVTRGRIVLEENQQPVNWLMIISS